MEAVDYIIRNLGTIYEIKRCNNSKDQNFSLHSLVRTEIVYPKHNRDKTVVKIKDTN
jgi:hypothetical protein